ncbi:Panacea domain-containing protein [Alloscardovia venturai]|uniref:Panacea domain-containing protein n=1 Tax=Alloscardovia venturai TaxID=1769421 RepID=A0ABW2Y2R9_9BIFI
MAKVQDVARYILEKRSDQGHATTTFALQKFLYYSQAWMLVSRSIPLFNDEISAWEHGPVVRSIWNYCRNRRYISPRDIPDGDTDALLPNEEILITRILNLYADIPDACLGDELEKASHLDKPWQDAYCNNNKVITQNVIHDYYASLQADPSIAHGARIPMLADISNVTYISDEDSAFLDNLLAR